MPKQRYILNLKASLSNSQKYHIFRELKGYIAMFLCKSNLRAFGFRAFIFGLFCLPERAFEILNILSDLSYIALENMHHTTPLKISYFPLSRIELNFKNSNRYTCTIQCIFTKGLFLTIKYRLYRSCW